MSSYQVTTFVNGKWQQNCYLIANDLRQALIIDPGSDCKAISDLVSKLGLRPVAILNTHAHFDHIGAITGLLKEYSIPFFLHRQDEKLLRQANVYKLLFESSKSINIPSFDKDFAVGPDMLEVQGFQIHVIHTPGHTRGSVCLLIGNNLFSGDMLLPSGPGRTDLPGGDKVKLQESLVNLSMLPTGHLVYPGHGMPFTLKEFWTKIYAS